MRTIENNISDMNNKILSHVLESIEAWITGDLIGKINSCKTAMAREYRQLLVSEGATMIPASDDAAVAEYLARADYKPRWQRDKEALAAIKEKLAQTGE